MTTPSHRRPTHQKQAPAKSVKKAQGKRKDSPPLAGVQYGWHSVHTCLNTAPTSIAALFMRTGHQKNSRTQTLLQQASTHSIPVTWVDQKWFDTHFPHCVHQGILAQCQSAPHEDRHQPPHTLDSLLPLLRPPCASRLFLILDGVQDPHNLGACLRTALAAQATAVIIPQRRAVGLTPSVHKVACGATAHLPVVTVTNLSRALVWLKKHGVWLYGAADTAPHSLFEINLTQGPIAWVLGAEGRGLRTLTAQQCDYLVRIPTDHRQSSLNVSVASGICCFETLRQQQSC